MNSFLQMANSGTMYLIVGVVILFVTVMAIVFMVKAWREGIKIGMDKKKMRKAITASATFTLVPSVGILIGVIALAGSLGVPVPWLRLSVIGALHYETMAADVAAKAAGLPALAAEYMTGEAFVSIIAVMTVGIIWGAIFCIFGLKKYQSKVLNKVGKKDDRWGNIMFNAMFVGMVCAFIGAGFADLRKGSITSIVVIAVAAAFMALFSWLIDKKGQKWLESFSLSFAMVLGMGASVVMGLLGVK
ncbi:DUF5058 family protein [Ruminococcaceae bacterium OttesenSCG-928-A16]|nr:DUF5058 family protein [Ruminococcaceae bacterium OttesenSCG-928-A16]